MQGSRRSEVPHYGSTSVGTSTSRFSSDEMHDDPCYECNGGVNDDVCKECCPRIHRTETYRRLNKMEIKYRICILLVLVALMVITFALMTRFAMYSNTTLQTSSGEMRPIAGVTEAYSDHLCSSVYIKTTEGSEFDAYVFGETPNVGSHEKFTITKRGTMNHSEYVVWMFYLIGTSEVKVQTCAENSPVEFWIIRGVENWKKWQSSAHCSGCYVHHETYLPCGKNPEEYTFQILSTNEYYFAYVNREAPSKLSLHVTFVLDRALYDTSVAHIKIYNISSTVISINFGDLPVLRMSTDGFKDMESVYVECLPNILMYSVYFGVVPIGCTLVIAAFVWFLIRVQRSIIRDVNNADRARHYRSLRTTPSPQPGLLTVRRPEDIYGRQLLSWSSAPPSAPNGGGDLCVAVADLPPDYNSVAHSETDQPPPSYEEVQAGRANHVT